MKNRPMALLFFVVFLGVIMYFTRMWWLIILPPVLAIVKPIQQFPKSGKGYSILLFFLLFGLGTIRTVQIVAPLSYIQSNIEEGQTISLQGKLYKKDVKESMIVYYLQDACSEGKNLGNILYYPETDTISLGSVISLQGTVSFFENARNEGGFDTKTYYYSQNIYMKLDYVQDVQVLSLGNRFREWLFQLQQRIKAVEMQYLPAEEGGLLAAITVGDRGGMEEEIKSLFANVGISHIIAVSGLHVSIVGMGLYQLLRRKGYIIPSAIIAGTIVVLYGVLCGNSISTVRAVGMFLLSLAALMMLKDYDACSGLFFMATCLILKNPFCIYNISFQMSFVIVFGVICIASPLGNAYDVHCRLRWEKTHKKSKGRKWKPTRREKLVRGVIVSFMIQLCSLPVVLWYFYTIPVYSLILNIILLPLIGLLLGCGLMAGLTGALISVPEILLKYMFLPSHLILYFYEMLSSIVSKLPFCSLIIGRLPMGLILFYYAVIFSLSRYISEVYRVRQLKALAREDETGRSYEAMPRKQRRTVKAALVIFLLMPLLILFPKKEEFEIGMLDVGQGDGMYLQDGMGQHYFIDGGSTSKKSVGTRDILSFLKYRGVASIDYWFVTHMDEDHVSGLMEVLESGYTVRHIVFARYVVKNENYEKLCELAEKNGAEIISADRADSWRNEDSDHFLSWQVLYAGTPEETEDANANSLVLLLTYDGFQGIFTGDIAIEQEDTILSAVSEQGIGRIDFLKVAHHGSNYSSGENWCNYLRPKIAFCSVAEKNNYGHPGAEAVSRLENAGCELYYTKNSGELLLHYQDDRIFIREMIR